MSARRWTAVLTGLALPLGIVAMTTSSPATAIPTESHCGTEAYGSGNNGFVDHAQLSRTLEGIERSTKGVVDVEVVGESNQGREIYTARVGEGDTVVFVESQIHGNENHGTEALLDLLRRWGGSTKEAQALREEVTIVAIPRLNVDGGERDTRQNEMTWADVVAAFPQLAGVAPAWNYNSRVEGFDAPTLKEAAGEIKDGLSIMALFKVERFLRDEGRAAASKGS